MLLPDSLAVLVIALLVDALVGDPDFLWRRYAHPVVWIGALIRILDHHLNRQSDDFLKRRLAGVLALVCLLAACGLCALALDSALRGLPGHSWTTGVIASVLIAQNSLYRHVARVRDAMKTDMNTGGLAAARKAVSMIVGRNPDSLDEAGISRAAIETTAENFSDGVVAPAFWCAVGGLPGLVLYKAINTADSMIGHRSIRYEAFGWAAARLDDLVNLVPARLSGLLIVLATPLGGGSIMAAFRTMMRDARLHKSPNAGWPEGAMAGALGIALAGPRRYGDRVVEDPFLNSVGRHDASEVDIGHALRILWGAWSVLLALVALAWWLTA